MRSTICNRYLTVALSAGTASGSGYLLSVCHHSAAAYPFDGGRNDIVSRALSGMYHARPPCSLQTGRIRELLCKHPTETTHQVDNRPIPVLRDSVERGVSP